MPAENVTNLSVKFTLRYLTLLSSNQVFYYVPRSTRHNNIDPHSYYLPFVIFIIIHGVNGCLCVIDVRVESKI